MAVSLEPAAAARSIVQAITDFAADHPAGSLDIVRGHTAAIVHVADGRLTSAEPSTAPGIAQRLIGSGRLSRDAWHELRSNDQLRNDQLRNDRQGLAARLVQSGVVDPGTLATLTRSVLVDALLDLAAAPGELDAAPLDGEPDWLASPLRLDPDDVLREVARRTAERAAIPPRAVVALRRPALRSVVLSRAQLTVACHARRGSTSSEIARESGLALYETDRGLAELIDSGLCVLDRSTAPVVVPTPRPPDAGRLAAAAQVTGTHAGQEDHGADLATLPRRVPGSSPGLAEPAPNHLALPAHNLLGHQFTEPDEHVLRQVLAALEDM
jgi:hypothetical protein